MESLLAPMLSLPSLEAPHGTDVSTLQLAYPVFSSPVVASMPQVTPSYVNHTNLSCLMGFPAVSTPTSMVAPSIQKG